MIHEALESKELDWKTIQLKRGQIISRPNEVEKYIYFVKSGALRAYCFVEEQEFTVRFGYTNSIFTSLSSYFSGESGEMTLEAIRVSEVLRCTKQQFEKYIVADMDRLMKYKNLLEYLVIGCIERENDLMLQDPKSRIERVRKRSPQLFQEIPHKYIASYLRMSPETLSRNLKS